MNRPTPMPIDADDIHRLEELQAAVTAGEAATLQRNELAFRVWRSGMTQREIADILDRIDLACGGNGVSRAMTAKMLARLRATREDEMLTAAIRS